MSPYYAGQDLKVSSCRHLNGMLQFNAQPVKLFNLELEHASTSGCAFSTLLRYMSPPELPLAQHVLNFHFAHAAHSPDRQAFGRQRSAEMGSAPERGQNTARGTWAGSQTCPQCFVDASRYGHLCLAAQTLAMKAPILCCFLSLFDMCLQLMCLVADSHFLTCTSGHGQLTTWVPIWQLPEILWCMSCHLWFNL